MFEGVIRQFNTEKGFGFIRPDDGGEDIFLHAKYCVLGYQPLSGQRVEFDVVPDERRSGRGRADMVRRLD